MLTHQTRVRNGAFQNALPRRLRIRL